MRSAVWRIAYPLLMAWCPAFMAFGQSISKEKGAIEGICEAPEGPTRGALV